jgi:hypothetical protein
MSGISNSYTVRDIDIQAIYLVSISNFSERTPTAKMAPTPCGEVKTTEGLVCGIPGTKMAGKLSTKLVFFVNGKKVIDTFNKKKVFNAEVSRVCIYSSLKQHLLWAYGFNIYISMLRYESKLFICLYAITCFSETGILTETLITLSSSNISRFFPVPIHHLMERNKVHNFHIMVVF